MQKNDIEGLTPIQIKDKYALPELPTHMVDVKPMPGTNINVGGAAGYKEGNKWGKGEGRQWYIDQADLPNEWFGNSKRIKEK